MRQIVYTSFLVFAVVFLSGVILGWWYALLIGLLIALIVALVGRKQ